MKITILAGLMSAILGIAAALADSPTTYHAPAYNFRQNNWMANG